MPDCLTPPNGATLFEDQAGVDADHPHSSASATPRRSRALHPVSFQPIADMPRKANLRAELKRKTRIVRNFTYFYRIFPKDERGCPLLALSGFLRGGDEASHRVRKFETLAVGDAENHFTVRQYIPKVR
jgi:hypothetical protein